MNTMFDGLVTINEKGIILSTNKTLDKIYGCEVEEIVRETISRLMPSKEGKTSRAVFKRAITGKYSGGIPE